MAARWRLMLLAVYAVVTAAAMIAMGQPDTLKWYLLAVPFFLWAMAPVAWLCLRRKRPLASGIGAAVCAAAGAAIFGSTAWLPPVDAQAGLVFVFLPAYQFAFALLWVAALAIIARLTSKES